MLYFSGTECIMCYMYFNLDINIIEQNKNLTE